MNLSNTSAGSDVVSMKCKADRVDGGYVINGNKMWCTNGPVAQTLVIILLITCILVEILLTLPMQFSALILLLYSIFI